MLLRPALGLVGALLGLASCAADAGPRPAPVARAAPRPFVSAPLTPARYLYVDRLGSFFDEAGVAPGLPGVEPALLDGVRVLVRNGLALDHALAADKLMGFRSLPARLGGGYVLWSDARTYRARSFLGALEPIVDTGASGGARPFLRSFLLRTTVGVLEVDPSTLAAKRVLAPGLTEALALDEQRALRLDLLGRTELTTDGGAHFTDLLREQGLPFTTLREGPAGDLLLGGASAGPALRLAAEGPLAPLRDRPNEASSGVPDGPRSFPELTAFPSTSRALPPEIVAHAAMAGVLLGDAAASDPSARAAPGCAEPSSPCARPPLPRLLVARERGLRVLALDTLLPIVDQELLALDPRFARCQPWMADTREGRAAPGLASAAREPILLACTGEDGSALLTLSESTGRPRLHMTFPEQGVYLAGPSGRLAFPGRCGPTPPSSADLGLAPRSPSPGDDPGARDPSALGPAPTATSEEPAPSEPPPPDSTPPPDARVCVRASAGHFLERRLPGAEARWLYRWVPADEGAAVAVLLGKKPDASAAAPALEGVTCVWIDPTDPALRGGRFPALPAAQRLPPHRTIDQDFWRDDDGSLRGWLRLPDEGEAEAAPAESPEPTGPPSLPVDPRRGGRAAGLRVDPSGKIDLFPLPPQVTQVVYGGRFALASSVDEGRERFHESIDGGRSWAPIEGPPTGGIEPPSDEGAPFGCSSIGCALGGGVVRLGWGGAPPRPPSPADEPTFAPAANPLFRSPRALALRCRIDALEASLDDGGPASKRPPAPRLPRSRLPTLAPASPPRTSAKAPGKARKPGAAPKDDTLASPPPTLSLHLGPASPLGALHEGTWSADLWLPFQPRSAPRHLSVRERALSTVAGAIVPVLGASPRAPVDLLLSLGKYRLRASEPQRFTLVEAKAKITVAADLGEGALLLLDADKGQLWLARGEGQSPVLKLIRVPEVARTRLTLARALDGSGVDLVGYSTSSGEVFAGAIDLARAEVGPLRSLGRLDAWADPEAPACRPGPTTRRFLAELPSSLVVVGKGDLPVLDRTLDGTALIEATGDRLCLRGFEASLARGGEVELSARFGEGAGAALRREGKAIPGSCAVTLERR